MHSVYFSDFLFSLSLCLSDDIAHVIIIIIRVTIIL